MGTTFFWCTSQKAMSLVLEGLDENNDNKQTILGQCSSLVE
jgi:hypothetical protein